MKIKITHTTNDNQETILFDRHFADDDDYVMIDIVRDGTKYTISPNWEEGKDGIEISRLDHDYIVELPSDDLLSVRHA